MPGSSNPVIHTRASPSTRSFTARKMPGLIVFLDRSDSYHPTLKRLFACPPKLVTSFGGCRRPRVVPQAVWKALSHRRSRFKRLTRTGWRWRAGCSRSLGIKTSTWPMRMDWRSREIGKAAVAGRPTGMGVRTFSSSRPGLRGLATLRDSPNLLAVLLPGLVKLVGALEVHPVQKSPTLIPQIESSQPALTESTQSRKSPHPAGVRTHADPPKPDLHRAG